jgi:hypothetical protein
MILNEFEIAGGIDALEVLQTHSNEFVYKKAYEILRANFDIEKCWEQFSVNLLKQQN